MSARLIWERHMCRPDEAVAWDVSTGAVVECSCGKLWICDRSGYSWVWPWREAKPLRPLAAWPPPDHNVINPQVIAQR